MDKILIPQWLKTTTEERSIGEDEFKYGEDSESDGKILNKE
jgi:hypothetical protein